MEETPAWISAYGSYGASSYTPNFVGRLLALIDAGFVVGYANVRGGGEYGRDWHKAGQLMNKPNTWRDLIACGEYLIGVVESDAACLRQMQLPSPPFKQGVADLILQLSDLHRECGLRQT